MKKHIAIGLLLGLLLAFGIHKVHAQAITSATPWSFSATGTLANCPAIASGSTQYCFTMTGLYQSISGAAWTLVGAGSGVTSVELCVGTACSAAKTGAAVLTLTPAAPTITSTSTVPGLAVQ